MELINKIRKSRKGFTLVEIIVVLVILAILAAFTIPAMLGFVNDANSKALVAEAREVYVAAQATATEYNATKSSTDAALTADNLGSTQVNIASPSAKPSKQMKKLLGEDVNTNRTWTVVLDTATGKVTSVTYSDGKHTLKVTAGSGTEVLS